jgi:hypothetical protein
MQNEHRMWHLVFDMLCRVHVDNHILFAYPVPGYEERGRRRVWDHDIAHSYFDGSRIDII